MWKQSDNIVHRLFSRQVSCGHPNTHIHRAREFYETVVPSHTVYEVDCPDQWWRRFTNDGQYLICFSRTSQDLLIYRPLWLSYCSTLDAADELPAKGRKFESYFSLLHQVSLATGPNEVICKDFFLSTENNLYGIFATSTAQDLNAAATNGSLPGVPCIEKITFLVVRFADGVITGRYVFRDDYIHLAHNAGVFLHDDLLAILSIRFQRIHILQVREGGLFLEVRTVGDFCREDDELLLSSLSQAEAKFQEEQRLQRKAQGRVEEADTMGSAPQPSKTWGIKPWAPLNDRKRSRLRDSRAAVHDDSGTSRAHLQYEGEGNGRSPGDDIDILYDGYFRGLFAGVDGPVADVGMPNGNGGSMRIHTGGEYVSYANGNNPHIRRFRLGADSGGHSNGSHHMRMFPGGGETVSHTSLHRRRFVSGSEQHNYEISASGRQSGSHESISVRRWRDHATYETSTGRRLENNVSTSGSLYSSSGSDTASHSFNSTMELGSSDATAVNDFSSSHSEGPGPSDRWTHPVPSMSASGRSIGAPQTHLGPVFRDESSLGGPSVGLPRSGLEGGDQGTTSAGTSAGRPGQLGQLGHPGSSGISHAFPGPGSVRGGGLRTGNEVTSDTAEDVVQDGSQILRGLKQRLLSFILQGIQNDDTTPASKANRLKRFYYHFQHYVDLVMWKVQFLDRQHLLIKFGSVEGVVLRNSEASNQTAFLAIYNMETTEILGFYQNSSEELLQLVERYWDHFRVAPPNPLYMNFISSYANNPFAREQLRKQKAACMSGKAGSYTQVVKRTLALLPHNSQSQSPSAYFDQYLFHYDEKLISSTDRHKPCMEHPIKFISRRRPNTLKFKINPGLELGSNDGHIKRVASFLFHPIFPFAISVQQSFMQTTIVNFHFRR